MPLVAQHGVVLLPTLLTPKGHLVGVMSLEVVLQVVLPVECLLTVSTLVRFLGRMGSHVPRSRRKNFIIDSVCFNSQACGDAIIKMLMAFLGAGIRDFYLKESFSVFSRFYRHTTL